MGLSSSRLKRAVTVFAVAALFLFLGVACAHGSVKAPSFPCGGHKAVISDTVSSGYAYALTAVSDRAFTIQLYIDVKNGDWRILGLDDDMACIILQGTDMQLAFDRGA